MTNKRFREIEELKKEIDVLYGFVQSINDITIYVGDGCQVRDRAISIYSFIDSVTCSAMIADMKYKIKDRYEKLKEEYAKI